MSTKMPDTSGFAKKKTEQNTRITDTERKIPSIIGLATTTALNDVDDKILGISNLVKKRKDYDQKNYLIQTTRLKHLQQNQN